MKKEELILIGGGGHCKAVIDVIEMQDKYKVAGIVDLREKIGYKILGYEIIAADDDLLKLINEYKNFFITIGQIQSAELRIRIFNILKEYNITLPIIISPYAYVSKHSKIGEGTVIMHHAIINANSSIGKNCIINNQSLIEHDVVIKDNCHISTGAIVNGGCTIGDECLIGSNSATLQYIDITTKTIIGAGVVVTKDITESGVYVGSSAKKIK